MDCLEHCMIWLHLFVQCTMCHCIHAFSTFWSNDTLSHIGIYHYRLDWRKSDWGWRMCEIWIKTYILAEKGMSWLNISSMYYVNLYEAFGPDERKRTFQPKLSHQFWPLKKRSNFTKLKNQNNLYSHQIFVALWF